MEKRFRVRFKREDGEQMFSCCLYAQDSQSAIEEAMWRNAEKLKYGAKYDISAEELNGSTTENN
jgi:hypothetical protein